MSDQNAKLIASSRQPGSMSDLYTDTNIPDHYEDGVGQMLLGPAVTKLSFFRTKDFTPDESGNSIEQRFIDLKITIPTTALIQWAAGVISTVAANREAINTTSAAALTAIDSALEAIKEASSSEKK